MPGEAPAPPPGMRDHVAAATGPPTRPASAPPSASGTRRDFVGTYARISTAERQLQSAGDVTGAADLLQAPVDADVTVLASVDLDVLAHRIAVLSALGEVEVVDDRVLLSAHTSTAVQPASTSPR